MDDANLEDMQHTLARHAAVEVVSPPLAPERIMGSELSNPGVIDDEYDDALDFDPIKDEIAYPQVLNRLLPPDIRILAWCPAPPVDFSARFSCRERRYKYFFTQPAFAPLPGIDPGGKEVKTGWLDIGAMQEAASHFVGTHDWRNFCKVDPGKQISNFDRAIYRADIEEIDPRSVSPGYVNGPAFAPAHLASAPGASDTASLPKIYTFNLHGSAFLWHQVRHMVAVLFLVGQGLEPTTITRDLLDVEKTPRRPRYEMAVDTPLVLWDCIFPYADDEERKDALDWVYVGDGHSGGEGKFGVAGLMDDLWKVWRERKIDEMLAGSLMDIVARQGLRDLTNLTGLKEMKGWRSQKVFDGDDAPRLHGNYVPIMKKPLLESVDEINERHALRKGYKSSQDMKNAQFGFRRLKALEAEQWKAQSTAES